MKSEPISFSKGDHFTIVPTPLNKAKHARNEFKGLELNKEYVVADTYRKWDKWYVSVELENGTRSQHVVADNSFSKK
ncbi:MAG: hypothetical protein LiPW41_679 [Parcubacteria group bacterium LiPW_41]|nr:MAG: hypothetical protein LiPW41_679 [Parcubacteria group bacterium LiPW_41]